MLTPYVMERLAALYPKEKAALHVTFDGDRLYMCISKSDKYMVFDEEKNIKSMNDVEAYLDKYLRMLQETLDAALLLQKRNCENEQKYTEENVCLQYYLAKVCQYLVCWW